MSIDLSQFHQVFYEESFEGLDVMESSLMEIDPDNIDAETINAIFRSAHSIKGGSATFGFVSISDFTHDLETILDQVRAGKRGITTEDVNVYLRSVDCMREMLQLLQDGEDVATPLSIELKAIFTDMLAGKSPTASASVEASAPSDELGHETSAVAPASNATENQTSQYANSEPTNEVVWSISFVPEKGILRTGNDVVRIFRELAELGTISRCDCTSSLPNFKSFDPEECCLRWSLEFSSCEPFERIQEVFEWVADESELKFDKQELAPHWKIGFRPGKDILRTGNEPLRLFSALKELGDVSVKADTNNLPSLNLLDHEECHLSWQIALQNSSASEEDIREIFEWVIDDAELHIARVGSESVSELQEAVQPVSESTNVAVETSAAAVAAKPEPNVTTQSAKSSKPATAKVPKAKKSAAETGSIRVGIDKVDNLINMVGELVITQSMLGQLGTEFDVERIPKLMEGLGQLEQNTRELQESVMRIRMLPISFAFSRFPRMVRDLGQTLGKQLHLEMLGEQTELDKTVMEKIGDPLVHLVRNAVDHGIESPEERIANGKPAEGTITLNAYHQGGNVVIEIADDGKGLDREKLIAKAIEKNILSPSDAEFLTEEGAYDLIFQPGFSTAQTVSDVSGRGVGMDVVRRNIQALSGSVEIVSQKGHGSKITIRLPLTLAILDGQLVRVGSDTYIFPLVSIVESLQCSREFVSKVAGGCDVFKLRDDYVPIVELYKAFSVPPGTTDLDQSLMVVVESDGEKVGIVVDELLAQQQVVIKSLEQNYRRVDGISGATILGDGTVALIIDIPGVVKLAGEKFGVSHQMAQGRNVQEHISKMQMVG